jgi:hypothetical protein
MFKVSAPLRGCSVIVKGPFDAATQMAREVAWNDVTGAVLSERGTVLAIYVRKGAAIVRVG